MKWTRMKFEIVSIMISIMTPQGQNLGKLKKWKTLCTIDLDDDKILMMITFEK